MTDDVRASSATVSYNKKTPMSHGRMPGKAHRIGLVSESWLRIGAVIRV